MDNPVKQAMKDAGEILRALPEGELEARLKKGTPPIFEGFVRISEEVGYEFESFRDERPPETAATRNQRIVCPLIR
jgi:hypothetical protein